jgi:hypothetical protein
MLRRTAVILGVMVAIAVPGWAQDADLATLGRLPVSLQAGVGRWLTSPDSGPDGWRFRLQANFVVPKR